MIKLHESEHQNSSYIKQNTNKTKQNAICIEPYITSEINSLGKNTRPTNDSSRAHTPKTENLLQLDNLTKEALQGL